MWNFKTSLANFIKVCCLLLLRSYQIYFSPFLGGQCRFQPSCSCYAAEAFEKLSLTHACSLVLRRFLRCAPWGSFGWDPVPAVGACTHE